MVYFNEYLESPMKLQALRGNPRPGKKSSVKTAHYTGQNIGIDLASTVYVEIFNSSQVSPNFWRKGKKSWLQ